MLSKNATFEGWYFKHQNNGETVSFIPGKAEGSPFVQVITNKGTRHYRVPDLCVTDKIYAGSSSFSREGITVDLPGINGRISYGPVTSLSSDIMGPFRHLPMECRHGVISMRHSLEGYLFIEGEKMVFDGGTGYIESDRGRSFPSEYLWLQCNDFETSDLSIMVSVANIPFAGFHFTGCICAVVYRGVQYRLATYKGVHIIEAGPEGVCLEQGKYLLRIDIKDPGGGYSLNSPVNGAMSGMVKECNNASARFRLWQCGTPVFDISSSNVSFECELLDSGSKIRRFSKN